MLIFCTIFLFTRVSHAILSHFKGSNKTVCTKSKSGLWKNSTRLFHFLISVCELCSSVRASRATKFVAEGGSLQLGCEVQHCGLAGWTGGWVFQELNTLRFTSLIPSERIEMSRSSSTANSTHLLLHIHNINQSDAGAYKCLISWPQNITSSGHVTYVNVTAGIYICMLLVWNDLHFLVS